VEVEILPHETKIRLEKNNTSQKKPLLKKRLKKLAGNNPLLGT
jgi:HEAT repeats